MTPSFSQLFFITYFAQDQYYSITQQEYSLHKNNNKQKKGATINQHYKETHQEVFLLILFRSNLLNYKHKNIRETRIEPTLAHTSHTFRTRTQTHTYNILRA